MSQGGAAPSELAAADRARFNAIALEYCRKDLSPAASVARRHRLRQTLRPIVLDGKLSILEVGCGAGFSARYLEGMYSSYTGLDYAENLIEYARQHLSGDHVRKSGNPVDQDRFARSSTSFASTSSAFPLTAASGQW